jgi:hypothetical protein
MNQIQEAIARVTGLDDVVEGLHNQVESVQRTNVLLQHQLEDLDYLNLYDLHNIQETIPLGRRRDYVNRMRRMRHENPLAKQSVKLILRFTLGRGVQISIGPDPEKALDDASQTQLPVDDESAPKLNGLFPGPRNNNSRQGANLPPLPRARPQVSEEVDSGGEDPLKDIVTSFWKDKENQVALTSKLAMKDWLDGNVTDGERFFICFEDTAPPYVKLTEIPLEEIVSIIYHPQNRLIPVYYKRVWQALIFEDGKYVINGEPKTKYYLDHEIDEEQLTEINKSIKIKGSEKADIGQRIFHTMVNPLWTKNGRRGISELFASREWFRVYKEFMEDRAAINSAATSIAFKRKVKAGPTGVAQFQGKFGGIDVGYENENNSSEIRKLTKPSPAAVYDSNPAVDLDWMKTDTGAVNAEKDGRALLMAAGSGTGIFAHYYGEGGDANLATAQAMELPMVKTFEDWQEWVNTYLVQMIFYVIRIATDVENAKKQIDRVSGTFPPLISQDVVKYTTAWSQVTQNVAPGNKIVHREAIRGVLTVMNVPNVDSMMNQIEAEEQALEVQRQAQQAAMVDAMKNQPDPAAENGNGNGFHARDGNAQALPPDLKTVAKGKPAPARNGPKPA